MTTYRKILALRQKHIENLNQKLFHAEHKNPIIEDYLKKSKPELAKLFVKLLGENKRIQRDLKKSTNGKFKDNNDREYTVAQWVDLQVTGILDNILWHVRNYMNQKENSFSLG